MERSAGSSDVLDEARLAVREADPRAFLVPGRIVRRVIKQQHELRGFGRLVPHGECYLAAKPVLLDHVAPDELGLASAAEVPDPVILLAQPDETVPTTMSAGEVIREAWRLLFHARVHLALSERLAAAELTSAGAAARIHRIGQVAFDEAESVLRHESRLIGRPDRTDVYVEFAAVFLELRHFHADRIAIWFPSLHDPGRIEAIIAEDIDPAGLLAETRPPGADEPLKGVGSLFPRAVHEPRSQAEGENELLAEKDSRPFPGTVPRPRPTRYRRLIRRARLAEGAGNDVSAAICCRRAALFADSFPDAQARQGAAAAAERLAGRLQDALQHDDEERSQWRAILAELTTHAAGGFWNAEKRLLYDLQKVCIDHERVVHRIDLAGWVRSLGREPLKRPLPNQREVLMARHLQAAASRVRSVQLSEGDRQTLSALLERAAHAAAGLLRRRLRPLIARTLDEVGLSPSNVPEHVARKKMIEELLDVVVRRGYLTMGHLRDAISRSRLKLADLSGLGELAQGDKLLLADRRLALALEGVYRRGEFYLRWLQRLSSIAFGTRPGRFLTKYAVLPFAGAFVALEGLSHLFHLVHEHPPEIVSPVSVLAWGCFLAAVMHLRRFRRTVARVFRLVFRLLRRAFFDLPLWIARRPLIQRLVDSAAFRLFRRWVFTPGVLTVMFAWALPVLGFYARPSLGVALGLYVTLTAGLNTRFGRDLEELAVERAERLWHNLRARVFVALFNAVMQSFKQLVEAFERLLYAVDEWLRFKSGETQATLAAKAVLGAGWAVVAYLSRFCVTLLVEPQINPIKHFPVVTVSHKIILPTQPFVARTLDTALDTVTANFLAAAIVTVIPGVFGFLVWELRSNWRLYEANRPRVLRPVIVGDHGETMGRLLRPGFHSGTLPKLYARLRRATARTDPESRRRALARYRTRLDHVEEAVRHFVERELVALLRECRGNQESGEGSRVEGRGSRAGDVLFSPLLTVGQIELFSNSLRVELLREANVADAAANTSVADAASAGRIANPSCGVRDAARVAFQEQGGRIVAGIDQPGWLAFLHGRDAAVFKNALAGLYKLGGVSLVREQIESAIGPRRAGSVGFRVTQNDPLESHPERTTCRRCPSSGSPYDINEEGVLIVWPGGDFSFPVRYDVDQRPVITPQPAAEGHPSPPLAPLSAGELVFSEPNIEWDRWVAAWEAAAAGREPPQVLPDTVPLLSENAARPR